MSWTTPGKQEYLWGIENAKLLSDEKRAYFAQAIEEDRMDDVRDELADAMEDEFWRIEGHLADLSRHAEAFLAEQTQWFNDWCKSKEKNDRELVSGFQEYCRIQQKMNEPAGVLDLIRACCSLIVARIWK